MNKTLALLAAVVTIAGTGGGASADAAEWRQAPAVAETAAVDPAKAALVVRYFEAIRLDDMMQNMLRSMGPSMMPPSSANLSADERQLIQDVMLESMDVVFPQMLEAFVELYADAFTLEELEALVAFYESPVGRSLTEKSVVLAQRSGAVTERFIPIMQREMFTRLCVRIDCTGIEAP